MNILGIIAEYNPFHNGHLYQLKKSIDAVSADFVVVIMSGNFTQRGEYALLSKWDRAKLAVECGVDLVIELPFVFACNNAEYFAKGAIEILNKLGCITHLSFGSEIGDLNLLEKIADILSCETSLFKELLQANLSEGLSYPAARSEVITSLLGEEFSDILNNPNNILAIEYLKQLKLTNSDIIPITVKRLFSAYHDTTLSGNIASATAIRKALFTDGTYTQNVSGNISDFIPGSCYETFKKLVNENKLSYETHMLSDDLYFKLISSKVITESTEALCQIFSISEGLENKLKSAIRTSDNLEQLKESLKSKRYTLTRINRLLVHTLFDLTNEKMDLILSSRQYYARILAFNSDGAKLIKYIKKNELNTIPLITNINKESNQLEKCQQLLSYDLISSDIFNLINQKNIYKYSDQVTTPYYYKNNI